MQGQLYLLLIVVLISSSGEKSSLASLVDIGNGVTQDDKGTVSLYDDQYWIQDLNLFVGLTYDQQVSSIENIDSISFGDISGWHFATYSEMLSLTDNYGWDEITSAFTPIRVETDWIGWKGRSTWAGPSGTHHELIMHHYLDGRDPEYDGGFALVKDDETFPGAFVTAYYNTNAVPIPGSFCLLVSGILGILGLNRLLLDKFRRST